VSRIGKKPRFETTINAFKIVLPNLNTVLEMKPLSDQTTEEDKVLQFIDTKGSAARRDIEVYLNIKQTTAVRLLRQMQQKGSLNIVGKGRFVFVFVSILLIFTAQQEIGNMHG
jgi:ATP-dependent DNA helicase RecG